MPRLGDWGMPWCGCREAFVIFDSDKDGFVDIKELIQVASTMGFDLNAEDLKACLDDMDEVDIYKLFTVFASLKDTRHIKLSLLNICKIK